MMRTTGPWLAAALLAMLAGCEQTAPGRIRSLGAVNETLAFTAAQEVMANYFQIDTVNSDTRQITCLPQPRENYRERLMGGSPTRQVANLRLLEADGQVMAQVAVAIQQQASETFLAVRGSDSYDSVPNQTPSELEAATTPEQNQTWKTIGYDAALEARILDDLFRRLHPELATNGRQAPSQPATQPAGP